MKWFLKFAMRDGGDKVKKNKCTKASFWDQTAVEISDRWLPLVGESLGWLRSPVSAQTGSLCLYHPYTVSWVTVFNRWTFGVIAKSYFSSDWFPVFVPPLRGKLGDCLSATVNGYRFTWSPKLRCDVIHQNVWKYPLSMPVFHKQFIRSHAPSALGIAKARQVHDVTKYIDTWSSDLECSV